MLLAMVATRNGVIPITRPVTLVVFLAALSLHLGCDSNPRNANDMAEADDGPQAEKLYLSTEIESEERISVLPAEGSEDKKSLLGYIEGLSDVPNDLNEYLPNTTIEWVVIAKIQEPLGAKTVVKKFGQHWRDKYGSLTIYGRDIATNRWSYLISADGPEQVDGLQFAWSYYPSWSDDAGVTPPQVYQARIEAIKRELSSLTTVTVQADVTSHDAHNRSKRLSQISEELNRSVTVRLVAPRGKKFGGRDVWDVMLCLGLRWGDMDCFHWVNSTGIGGDYHFDVWTSTAPGYFLPEEVAADLVYVEDLVFGYSIPRSADPGTVFERMMRAVRYSQERLGGAIQGKDGRALNIDAIAKEIETIADRLNQSGFPPGSDSALQQF